jgi:hypothetical protein
MVTYQLGKSEDLYSIISEADRVRICYMLLNRVKLIELVATSKAFPESKFKRYDEQECLMDFLKRTEIFVNIDALHSRSRVINQMKEFKLCELTGSKFDPKISLLKRSLRNWFVPVDLVRDYYGEEVAIYFEWMNFFLRWMTIPALGGIFIRLSNTFIFEPERSPMSALFAILMSIWAALFAINWKKHERSLKILWDNLVLTESKQQ